jgi:hypothetical protein
MRTLTFLALLSLSSIGAYGGLSDATSDSGQPLLTIPLSPSNAATSPSPNRPVGAIALGASSGGSARAATRDDDQLAANLATYVFLHKTWEDGLPVPIAARLSVCPE